MTWLTIIEYLCHKWSRICPTCRKHFPVLSSFTTFVAGFVTRLTRQVPLVEKELLTLPEHLSSPPVFIGVCVTRSLVLYVCCGIRVTRSLVLCVCFVDRCLSFSTFSFGHCFICSSVFWPLFYLFFCLLAIVLSVLLSFGHCFICSSVFWPLFYLFFFDIRILITSLVSSNSSYSKIFWKKKLRCEYGHF
jgi:hypothetical protein